MPKPYTVGFVTGCFDLMHHAHFAALQKMKQFCQILIVGLTTDTRCAQEKRPPILSYTHRFQILSNCQWVDVVVENVGHSKQHDWKKYRFDVLFSSEEYLGSDEFKTFEKACPDVPVLYLPRTSGISTSELVEGLFSRFAHALTFFRLSLNGPILKSGNILVKPIHVGFSEHGNTRNVYAFPFPNLPRNWKRVDFKPRHPMISGVNSNRELRILPLIDKYAWNPLLSVKHVYENREVGPIEKRPLFAHTQEERRYPRSVFWLYMQHAGITMEDWIEEHQDGDEFLNELTPMIRSLYNILQTLRNTQVVHGDVHANNVCIRNKQLFLIDWGWCMASQFDMEREQERPYFQSCLDKGFDWKHFVDSLEYNYHQRPWWDEVRAFLTECTSICVA